jgi:hypothetical protein
MWPLNIGSANWSDKEVEMVEHMLLDMKRPSEIAAVLGRTKNSVISIIWRTPRLKALPRHPPNGRGLPAVPWRRNPVRPPKPPKPEKEKKVVSSSTQEAAREALKARDGTPHSQEIVYGKRLMGAPRLLMNLNSWHCRFPMWSNEGHTPVEGQFYCAEMKAKDSSYCTAHRNLCRAGTQRGVYGNRAKEVT